MSDVHAGAQVRDWDQLERARGRRTEHGSAVIAGQDVAVRGNKLKRHGATELTGDVAVRLRICRVRLDLARSVVDAEIGPDADGPVISWGLARQWQTGRRDSRSDDLEAFALGLRLALRASQGQSAQGQDAKSSAADHAAFSRLVNFVDCLVRNTFRGGMNLTEIESGRIERSADRSLAGAKGATQAPTLGAVTALHYYCVASAIVGRRSDRARD